MVPLLSNSRIAGAFRDLMAPDFSFAPSAYLTNGIDANMSEGVSVPRGWPAEREAIFSAGRRTPWREKRSVLFWRGGETHPVRRTFSEAITKRRVAMPAAAPGDIVLCGSHCLPGQGVRMEDWSYAC